MNKCHFGKMTPLWNIKSILLFAIILRITIFIIVEPWNLDFETDDIFFHDPQEYHELAKSILEWDFLDNTIRTPGYPAFIAFFYWLFGVNPTLIYAVQLLLTVFSVFMTYKISSLFFGEKICLAAALLLAIDPHMIAFSFNLLSETLFVPMILAMAYYLIRFFQTKELKFVILASVFIALSAYVRPVTLYLAPSLLLIFYLLARGTIIDKFKAWGLMTLIVYLLLSPWYIRNYAKFESWSFCTTGGYNLLYVHAASIKYMDKDVDEMAVICKSIGRTVDSLSAGQQSNPFSTEKIQKELGIQIIQENPVALIKNHFVGVFNIFFSLSSYRISNLLGFKEDQLKGTVYGNTNISRIGKFIEQKGIFSIIFSALLLVLFVIEYSSALLGAIVSIRENRYVLVLTFLFLIVYLIGLMGLFWFQARFKLPLMPFYLIFSSYGIYTAKEWYCKRKKLKGD